MKGQLFLMIVVMAILTGILGPIGLIIGALGVIMQVKEDNR